MKSAAANSDSHSSMEAENGGIVIILGGHDSYLALFKLRSVSNGLKDSVFLLGLIQDVTNQSSFGALAQRECVLLGCQQKCGVKHKFRLVDKNVLHYLNTRLFADGNRRKTT